MTRKDALQFVSSLYVPWYSTLVRYACRLTHSIVMAEDVVQEAFFSLFRSLLQGTEIHEPKAWLLCVVRREACRQIQQESKRRTQTHEFAMESNASPAAHPFLNGKHDQADQLARMFSVLTAREEEVLLLRMQAMSYKEIGKELGISCNTVKTLLARGLRKMRTEAEQEGAGGANQDGLGQSISSSLQ